MRGTTTGLLCLTLGALALAQFSGHALAQSPLGIGATETAMPTSGLFGGFFAWINVQQQGFYRTLTGALRTMRDEGTGAWMLVAVSFAYGVFHAAGPGHGKAVISSYMLANEVALRRGVLLSFLSAMLQAITAIVVMSAVFLFLRGTAFSMSDATRYLEIASYALVMAFGVWLLWRKAFPHLKALFWGAPVRSLSASAVPAAESRHHHDHHHGPGEVCSTCGHSHAPDPKLISGDHFDWKTAWAAIVAVGVRPCTGALVVLSFAFLNGLWVSGIVSVFAMAFGTAITVSVLATLAVTAKNWAVAIGGDGRVGNRIHAGIEIFGAALVFLLGLTLLLAALAV